MDINVTYATKPLNRPTDASHVIMMYVRHADNLKIDSKLY